MIHLKYMNTLVLPHIIPKPLKNVYLYIFTDITTKTVKSHKILYQTQTHKTILTHILYKCIVPLTLYRRNL